MRDALLSLGLLWLRILAGAGIAYHGYGKIFGGKMEFMTQVVAEMGFQYPAYFAWGAALSEFVGGLLLMLGFATRLAGFFVLVTMGVAIFVRHAADPFAAKELACVYAAIAGTLFLTGAGKISFDGFISKPRAGSF